MSTAVDLRDRIGVREPYFALHDLAEVEPGMVRARMPVQCSPGRMVFPIGLSEAGRHLAILGLCAAATVNPGRGRHFYLAREVSAWSTVPDTGCDESARWVEGSASAVFEAPRRASARTRLSQCDGTPLMDLHVTYDVLSGAAFRRLFGDLAHEDATGGGGWRVNPYGRLPRLQEVKVTATQAAAALTVQPGMCPGHFPGYPALPVAITGGALTSLLDELVAHEDPGGRWIFDRFRLQADVLPRAGDRVELAARRVEQPVGHQVRCQAHARGRLATTLEIEYTPA